MSPSFPFEDLLPTAGAETGRIRRLPDALIDCIAAGEVVERPASVVKELVENALDAGARRIDVETACPGSWSLTVSDDGEGMTPDDLLLAFERHATSKIGSLDDLDRLTTLGFRGEALPSIAAVARVRAASAPRGATEGAEIELDGGRVIRRAPSAPRSGTVIAVHDLFAHTPARHKFLKSSATELSHVCAVVQQHALGHPGVSFVLTHEGRRVLEYPAAKDLADRLVQVYGREAVGERLIPVRGARGSLEVVGYCSRPDIDRATRKGQEWYVNGRPVRHPVFLRAVDQAYATRLMTGRHPVVVLCLRMPPSEVDVNVHPSKREVRFVRPDDVARLLTAALQDALSAADLPAPAGLRSLEVEVGVDLDDPNATSTHPMISEPAATYRTVAPPRSLELGPLFRYFGQYDRTYLVAEVDGELRVIDQHAAHERVLYERLVAEHAGGATASQPLLLAETCEYPPDQALTIRERLDVLREAGVEIEPFGPNTFVVRAVPALLAGVAWRTLVREMVEALTEDGAMESREPIHRLLATAACHAAVKAHQRLDDETTVALLRDLVATPRNATCPHGRPVSLRFAPQDLERAFGRRG
ncbi:MAG: DNA mismatch repair endonuclease MutL [Nitrospirota bacterium]